MGSAGFPSSAAGAAIILAADESLDGILATVIVVPLR